MPSAATIRGRSRRSATGPPGRLRNRSAAFTPNSRQRSCNKRSRDMRLEQPAKPLPAAASAHAPYSEYLHRPSTQRRGGWPRRRVRRSRGISPASRPKRPRRSRRCRRVWLRSKHVRPRNAGQVFFGEQREVEPAGTAADNRHFHGVKLLGYALWHNASFSTRQGDAETEKHKDRAGESLS